MKTDAQKKFRINFRSLGFKSALNIILIALVLGTSAVVFSYTTYKTSLENQLINTATNLAYTIAAQVEPESVEEYLSTGVPDDAYWETRERIATIQRNNDIEFAVVTKPTEEGFYYMYDTDETEEAWQLGDFEEYYPGDFMDNKANFLAGKPIPPIVSNEEFGWLLSVVIPIKDADGVMHAYVDVDMSMNEIKSMEHSFLTRSIGIAALLTIALTVISIFFARKILVKPIDSLSRATGEFIRSQLSDESGERRLTELPEIHSGDEVDQLYHSIRTMEQDLFEYIDHIKYVTAEKERIGAELSVATQIQASMLPSIFPAFPDRSEFDLYASMNPAKEVGGDFYDFFMVDDDHIALIIADVSGKGVPAALFMAISKVLLQNSAQVGKAPQDVLREVNNQLCANNDAGMFVTVWIGILEISTGKMTCANAGHEYPVIGRGGSGFELIRDRHGFVLAGMEGSRYRPYEVQLSPGDRFFVYTDGVAEATNADNELYGTDRMLAALNAHTGRTPKEILIGVKESIDAFVGEAPQFDDITMLCIHYKGPQA